MTAKKQAIMDIKDALRQNHKAFIAFRRELNPIMNKLVCNHIRQQQSISLWEPASKVNAQLVARCFFSHTTGTATLTNYESYYNKDKS